MVFKFRKEINLFNLIYDSMVVCLNIAFYGCVALVILLLVLAAVYRNPINMFIESMADILGLFVFLAVVFLITPLMCVIKTLFENKVIGMNCIKALKGQKLDDDNMYVTDDWFVIVTAEYFAVYHRKYIKKVQKVESYAAYKLVTLATVDDDETTYRFASSYFSAVPKLRKWVNNGEKTEKEEK
jgi:hypothetical protein